MEINKIVDKLRKPFNEKYIDWSMNYIPLEFIRYCERDADVLLLVHPRTRHSGWKLISAAIQIDNDVFLDATGKHTKSELLSIQSAKDPSQHITTIRLSHDTFNKLYGNITQYKLHNIISYDEFFTSQLMPQIPELTDDERQYVRDYLLTTYQLWCCNKYDDIILKR